MSAPRQSVLGPDEDWRDPSFGVTERHRSPRHRPSLVGPATPLPAPPRAWTWRRALALLAAAAVLSGAAVGWRTADGYDPLRPGPTFGLEGALRQVDAGEDGLLEGTYRFGDAVLPYRDGEVTTWTYSLENHGHVDVEVLDLEAPTLFHAEVVDGQLTHERNRFAQLPLVLEPGQSLRVDLGLRSVRCEQGDAGLRQRITAIGVRQRALGLVRERYVELSQTLEAGIDTPGSKPCPRASLVPPPEPTVSTVVPPY